MNGRKKIGLAALAVMGVAMLTGCGIAEGDYVIYRVAFEASKQNADCYAPNPVPPNVAQDSSNVRSAGLFILYVGHEDNFYLDNGSSTYEGVETDEGYEFKGKTTDVDYSGANDEIQNVSTNKTTINFAVDGALIQGTDKGVQSTSCSTGDMNLCPNPPSTRCTTETDFIGSEIEDVELRHNI